MKRLWPLMALLLLAATADETRQYRVAQTAFEDKLYDVAERQLQDFLDKYPKSERADIAGYLLGQAQFHLGKWEAAVRTFQDAAARWPEKRPDGLQLWLGDAYSRGEKFIEAEEHYGELIAKHPHSKWLPQAFYGLAVAQFRQHQFNAASDTLDKLAKEQPRGDLAFDADLLRGQVHLARDDFANAESVLEAVARRAGNTQRVYYRAQRWLGESLMRRSQFPEALARYATVTDAFKAKPNRPVDAQLAAEAFYGAGWTLWQTGDFAGAAESFTMTLATAPGETLRRDALVKLAEAYARDGKIPMAVGLLKDFLKTRPGDPFADDVQLAIGDLLFGKEDYAAALPEYLRLVADYPASPLLGNAYRQAGWCAWQLRKLGDALADFQKALPLLKDPGQAAETLFKLADTQFVLGQFSDAAASYQTLIDTYKKSPTLDHALHQLGETYRKLQKPADAARTFELLVKSYPTSAFAPLAQYNLGQLLAAQGNEEGARAAYATVANKFPTSVWASNAALAVGESYDREGKSDQAIAEFDKLAVNGLETILAQQAFYSRGLCYAQTGKREKTLGDFLEFLKLHPAVPLAPNVQFWIGHEYLRQRDYLKAQAEFQLLAETYPTSAVADAALYFAGSAAYARQDYKAAVEIYEALVKKFPQSNWRCKARFGQGDALSELGQFDDALLVFEALTKDFPDCSLAGEAVGRKGDCQYTLGRYDAALVSYQKVLDGTKDTAARSQALFKLGQTYEKMNKLDEAYQQYSLGILGAMAAPNPQEPPERFWSCKAARAAAALKEQGAQWRDAITLYNKLAAHCPDLKEMAEDRIRKLLARHPENLFGQ